MVWADAGTMAAKPIARDRTVIFIFQNPLSHMSASGLAGRGFAVQSRFAFPVLADGSARGKV
jgi:hypothetical protein